MRAKTQIVIVPQESATVIIPIEGLLVAAILALALFALAGFLILIIGPYFLTWWLGRKLHRKTAQRDSRGQSIPLTTSARFGLGNFSGDMTLLSGLGRNATPHHTLNEITLRPTIGLRLVSVLVAAAFWFLIAVDDGELLGDGYAVTAGLCGLWAYSFVQTNFYELRYDSHGFITRDWVFRRREVAWRDVIRIEDNGTYLYVIKMQDGSKLEIQKYLVGIRDFLTYAGDQMSYHNRP